MCAPILVLKLTKGSEHDHKSDSLDVHHTTFTKKKATCIEITSIGWINGQNLSTPWNEGEQLTKWDYKLLQVAYRIDFAKPFWQIGL
jgi:hypothetical protein